VSIRTVDEEKEREESERAVEAMRRGEYDEVNFEFYSIPLDYT
jgi:hypothetical protein